MRNLASKILKERSDVQGKCSVSAVPFTPSSSWHVFPSHNIPSLCNSGHVHHYVLERIKNIDDTQDIEDGLGNMSDKPLKNGGKYANLSFVHVLMDTTDGDRYLVRSCLALDENRGTAQHCRGYIFNSGAVLHASCEPCRASPLGRCSHVLPDLLSVLDYVQNCRPVFTQPCTSQEGS